MNIQSVAAWVAVVGFLGGGAWMIFQYDERIRTLETRVNILLGASPSRIIENAPSTAEDQLIEQMPNHSFKELCETLALRRADAIEAGKLVVDARELRQLMIELGCVTQ